MLSYIQNSLANLKAHKLRVSLAVFWIVIGITSVIVIGAIGNGAKVYMSQSMNNVMSTRETIEFIPSNNEMMDVLEFMNPITQDDISKIKDIQGVKKVGSGDGSDYIYGEVKINNSSASTEIYPFDENGNDENKGRYEIVSGRDFSSSDSEKNVIILNQDVLNEMQYPGELLGKAVDINGETYEVIGVMIALDSYNEFNSHEWNPLTYSSLVPQSTINKTSSINKNYGATYTMLDIEFEKGSNSSELTSKIINLLTNSHPGIEGYYQKFDTGYDPSTEIDSMLTSINMFVLLVTLISMFVGGIGVMNIMYVSVVERKREIGIRRAIGASPRKIIGQFLIESTVITSIGCILGLIVGSVALSLVSSKMPFNAIPTALIYLQAIVSSVLTGILSGVIPAFKASKIDPIDAIKG